MLTTQNEDPVYKFFRTEHSPEQFETNRNVALGSAGICAAIVLTIVQTQMKTEDATLSVITSCVAIPFCLLSAFINEYFLFLRERIYGFYEFIRLPLRLINTVAGGLLIASFTFAVRTISIPALYALIISAVVANVLFWIFHKVLAEWLKKKGDHPAILRIRSRRRIAGSPRSRGSSMNNGRR